MSSRPKTADGLTVRELHFVEAYCGPARANNTAAARLAGYKGNDDTLRVLGSRVLNRPRVRAAVNRRLAQALKKLGTDEIIDILATQATADFAALTSKYPEVHPPGHPKAGEAHPYAGLPYFDFDKAQAANLTRLVKSVRFLPGGALEVRLHDAQAAAALLARIAGLFNDRVNVKVDPGLELSELLWQAIGQSDQARAVRAVASSAVGSGRE